MTQLKMEREAALKDYLKVVAALPRVSSLQRLAWMDEWQRGRAESGRLLLESFLPMVVAAAAARRGLGVRFDALLAIGNRALAKALPQACIEVVGFEEALHGVVVAALKKTL